MPRPSSSTTIQRADLGALAYEYYMENDQFIGLDLLPVFEVGEKSSDYPVIPIEALMKMPKSLKRAPRGAYQRGDYEFETGTYTCEEYGWEEPIDEVEAALYRRFFDAESVATLRATKILLRDMEKRIADAVMNVSNITNTSAVTVEWSSAAGAKPKKDSDYAITTLYETTGVPVDTVAMSWKVFKNLMKTAEIKDYLQYTNPHMLSTREQQKEMLARYFDVERVLIGGAQYDSAGRGKAFSLSNIWSNEYVLFARVSDGGQDLKDPCLGRTFLWTEDSPEILVTEQYREEQIRSDVYRVRHNVDEAFVFTGAGFLLSNITA